MKFPRIVLLLALALGLAMSAASTATPLPDGMTAVPLATITNDRDDSVSRIQLMVNERAEVRGIYLETTPASGSQSSRIQGRVYWLDGIQSDTGVVLGQGQGVKAIFLKGVIQPRAGSLVIRYLHNGLFGSFDQCRINLRRVSPYHWQLVNAYTKHPIQRINVDTWALGISTLDNVCPTGTA